MPETTQPDLPDEPMDDATRARVRERVVSGLHDRPPSRRRAWLVPIAAAAAVGVVVGGAVVLGSGDDRDAGPASSPTAGQPTDPPSETSTDSPSETPSETLSDVPTDPSTVTTSEAVPDPAVEAALARCEPELASILPGAELAASSDDGSGVVAFYVAGGQYTLCDTHRAKLTVHHPKPLAGGGERNPYEVSSEFPGDGTEAQFVAGGPVPAGVEDFQVTYTFADGGVATSQLLGDPARPDALWWVVVHHSLDSGASTAEPPTVEVRGGPPATPLTITDICAQANHGC